jgi:hypothetical protein
LPHHSPSIITLNILQSTHINISAINGESLILFNQVVPADTTLEFTFDTEIKYDLLNASHIQCNLNGEAVDEYFTNDNASLRGSYIVESAQLYVGTFSLE